jgi:Domain of unknown function (DUF4865)
MLVSQYLHRLPAGLDMGRIRERATTHGPDWDNHPGLTFKAFLMREQGRYGAVANAYSSLYLWQDAAALGAFVADDWFRFVTDSFGRPRIETWVPFDVRIGRTVPVRSAWREETAILPDIDLPGLAARERERNQMTVERADVRASIVAFDLAAWRLARFVLSADEPRAREDAVAYEVLYLATPGLARPPG